MNELEEQLRQLVSKACQHAPNSPERQKYLTQIIRLTADKLWKENKPYYPDAVQQTWIYFCQNICEKGTTEPYDSTRSSVPTWLNAYLRRRLQDFYIAEQTERVTRATSREFMTSSGELSLTDPVEQLTANPDIPPILEEVKAWVEADEQSELKQTHLEGRTEINCQVLILRRLPPETSWKVLAEEWGVSISTLSSFYRRQCMPRLRKFAQSHGYV